MFHLPLTAAEKSTSVEILPDDVVVISSNHAPEKIPSDIVLDKDGKMEMLVEESTNEGKVF